jgi:hypothetical protein
MIQTETASAPRQIIADELTKAATRAAAARAALNEMRTRALEFRLRARDRARGEVERRRSDAADRLQSLAGALRPEGRAKDRRKAFVVAGGSTLALTAALGLGVALGLALSRELKKRAEKRAEMAVDEAMTPRNNIGLGKERPSPQAMSDEAVAAGLGL